MNGPDNLAALRGWINSGVKAVSITGLSGSLESYFFSQLVSELKRPSLVILPEKKEAQRFYHELSFFLSAEDNLTQSGKMRLYEFPPYDISPLTGISPHREVVARRLKSLYALMTEADTVVVTSLEAVLYRILPKEALVKSLEYLETGEEVDRERLMRTLEINGYQRVSIAEELGDYSVRGGVIDIYSPVYPMPVRLEFWGDRLESIRQFDPLSQRSQGHMDEMVLLPASEIIMDESAVKRARSMGRLPKTQKDGMGFPGQEAWISHFYKGLDTIFKYLPSNGLITVIDIQRAGAVSKRVAERFQKDVERYQKEAAERGIPFPHIEDSLAPYEELAESLELWHRLELSEIDLSADDAQQNKIHIKGNFFLDDGLLGPFGGKDLQMA